MVSKTPTPAISIEIKDGSSVFPLYLYPNGKPKASLFELEEPSQAPGGRRPNLSPTFVAALEGVLRQRFVPDGRGDLTATFGPEDIFHYMYAVFHAPSYRARYAEFLKGDFPRLPLPKDAAQFQTLCALGEELTALHLLERAAPPITSFPIVGGNLLEEVRYTPPTAVAPGRVHINKTQYFDNVPPRVWDFHVGGYQVCEKWLKDRKGRQLNWDDQQHYQRVTAALASTIRLMEEIDIVFKNS
jgi:hypothetical protein